MCARLRRPDDWSETNFPPRLSPEWPQWEQQRLPLKLVCSPTDDLLVLVLEDGKFVSREMRWGWVPSWAKTQADLPSAFNARMETLDARQSVFRAALHARRCVVLAQEFYEWKKVKVELPGPPQLSLLPEPPRVEIVKQKLAIARTDGVVLGLAGLWESWRDPATLEDVVSCTIVTCPPSAEMEPIHNRMPVVLEASAWPGWMEAQTPIEEVLALLHPAPEGTLVARAAA